MNDVTGDELKKLDKNSVLVIDYGDSSKKIKPLTDFPESIQFKPRRISKSGVDETVSVPVRVIKIMPLDGEGKLVDASKAKIINVQYLDESGSVLESTTMQGK